MSLEEMIKTIIKAGYEVRKGEYMEDGKGRRSFYLGVLMATKWRGEYGFFRYA